MKSSRKNYSGEELRKLRLERGLTQSSLSQITGLSKEIISQYETGRHKPSRCSLERLLGVLLLPPEGIVLPESGVAKRIEGFEVGKVYSIQNTRIGRLMMPTEINPSNGKHCKFRYEGKAGIHYVFREVHGGWSRTYTDAQLIGKTIKEVEE